MKPKRLAAADYFTSSPISRYEFSKPFEPSNNKISRRIEAILRCTAIKLPKKCGIKTTQARSHKSSQTPKASVLKVVVSKKHYRKSIKFEPNFSNLTQICRRAAAPKVPYSVFADRVRDPLARRIRGGYLLFRRLTARICPCRL